jgi:hypothetical protein
MSTTNNKKEVACCGQLIILFCYLL